MNVFQQCILQPERWHSELGRPWINTYLLAHLCGSFVPTDKSLLCLFFLV